nr:MAG TPA: GIY-YIG nuclease superfamily protein [Caudoviricetes sp.]
MSDDKYAINVSNLEIGQVFNNQREMCKYLNQEYMSTGNSKKSQLKEWKRYIDWEKDGQKIIVTEIYDTPLPKVDKRKNNGLKDLPDYKVFQLTREQYNSKGVYAIILNNDIYIGSTVNGFLTRYRQHCNPHNKLITYDMLNKGAIFTSLFIADGNCIEEDIRQKESELIDFYSNNKYWNVMNVRDKTHCTTHKGDIFFKGQKVTSVYKKLRNPNDIRYIKIKHKNYNKAIELLESEGLL